MNVNLLSVKMMLNLSARWLGSDAFRAKLLATGVLGQAILAELDSAHTKLATLSRRRSDARKQIRQLIEQCTTLDKLHNRKARASFRLLSALIEGCDEPERAAHYRKLQTELFPLGMRIVQLPYIEKGGAAVELERAIGPELRAGLEAIAVADQTLLDLVEAWISAGHELGEAIRQRAVLEASIRREGSAAADVDILAGRGGWQQALRGLLWAIEIRPELHDLAEPVEAALANGVEVALRRSAGSSSAGGEGEGQVDEVDVEAEAVDLEVDEVGADEVEGVEAVEVDVDVHVGAGEVEAVTEIDPSESEFSSS